MHGAFEITVGETRDGGRERRETETEAGREKEAQ